MKSIRFYGALCLFIFYCLPAAALDSAQIHSATVTGVTQLLAEQKSHSEWDGLLQSDPRLEVLMLLLGERLGKDTTQLFPNLRDRLERWRGAEGAWGVVPGGPPTINITGVILIGLAELGVERSDPLVAAAWRWFERNGGRARLGQLAKVMLYPLGLSELEIPVSVTFFGAPALSPININNMGIMRTLLVPLLVYHHYDNLEWFDEPSVLHPDRIASAGREFANGMRFFEPAEFWAQEGLGWMLARQQADGPWYTLQTTMLTLMALQRAQAEQVYDFQDIIDHGWQGLVDWIRTDPVTGERVMAPSQSEGWDTPLSVMALLGLPAEYQNQEVRTAAAQGVAWLKRVQPTVSGDWEFNAPDLHPGGWSFVEENPYYPDTDVTAAVLEAYYLALDRGLAKPDVLAPSVNAGFDWLLGMQNIDGGWGAWDRDVSHTMDLLSQFFYRVQVMDVGQVDVTARIIKMLVKWQDSPWLNAYRQSRVRQAIPRACRYIMQQWDGRRPARWYGDWAVNYVYATGEAVEALLSAGCWNLADALPSLRWLQRVQNDDGGWGESHDSYDDSDYLPGPSTLAQTYNAVRAMIVYEKIRHRLGVDLPSMRATIDRALEFLVTRINDGSGLRERSYAGVMIKGAWYADYALGPHWATLIVLGEYAQLPPLE